MADTACTSRQNPGSLCPQISMQSSRQRGPHRTVRSYSHGGYCFFSLPSIGPEFANPLSEPCRRELRAAACPCERGSTDGYICLDHTSPCAATTVRVSQHRSLCLCAKEWGAKTGQLPCVGEDLQGARSDTEGRDSGEGDGSEPALEGREERALGAEETSRIEGVAVPDPPGCSQVIGSDR